MKRKREGQSRATDPGRKETFTDHFNPVTAPPQMEAESRSDFKSFGVRRGLASIGDILPDVLNTLANRLKEDRRP
jgi:hypothetical protein